MLPYEYYLNTVTRTVGNHTTTVLPCHIDITLTQSHITSVNTATVLLYYLINITLTQSHTNNYSPVKLSYKYYLNTVTRTVSKHSYSPVMLSYKYYLNTVTHTVSKHTTTVLQLRIHGFSFPHIWNNHLFREEKWLIIQIFTLSLICFRLIIPKW
jgi:hypothetical protein